MSSFATVRLLLARVLAAALLIWPLVHIALVHGRDLSSWKLAGWGMYATMHPNHVGVHAFAIAPASRSLRDLRIGQAVATRHLAVYRDGETEDVSLRELPPDEGQELRGLLDRVRVLRGRRAMVAGAERLRVLAAAPDADVVFLLVVPRLDLFAAHTYTETAAYLVRGGDVDEIGRYASDRRSEEQILAGIERGVLDRPRLAARGTGGVSAPVP